jgi:hypothetical protein
MELRLEKSVSVGDLLTITSILGALLAWGFSWEHDRVTRQKAEADKVRAAAAETLVKLDRWEDLSVSVFSDVEASYIDTKESLRRVPGKAADVDRARHQLWKSILQSEVKVQQKILDDHIEAGYVGLYTYVPDARRDFDQLSMLLNNGQFHMYSVLLMKTQSMILATANDPHFNADEFYDQLQIRGTFLKNDYWKCIDDTLQPIRKALTDFTLMTDGQLLSKPHLDIDMTNKAACFATGAPPPA